MTSQYSAYSVHAGLTKLHALMRMHTHTRPRTHTHAPQCYFIRTLPALLVISINKSDTATCIGLNVKLTSQLLLYASRIIHFL
jgi:hypothetical protein